jgi:predicted metalloendopeptidase
MRALPILGVPSLVFLACVLAFSTAVPVLAQTPEASSSSILDPANMDQTVDPGEDFYRYVNGGWLDRTSIPVDWPAFGAFQELSDRTEQQLIALLQSVDVEATGSALTDQQKAALLFQQGLDLETRNTQGIAPLQPSLDRIDAVATLDDLHALWVDPEMIGFPDLFNLDVTPDPVDSTMNVLWLVGPYLGLPAVEYYTDDDPDRESARQAYRELVASLLGFAGLDEAEAATAAEEVYAFEASLAGHMITLEEAQDFSIMYNPVTAEDMAASYPMLDWTAYLDALNVEGSPTIINSERELIAELDALIAAADLEAIKNYLKVRALIVSYDLLGEDLEAAVFPYLQTLLGAEEQPPTEEEVLGVINGTMGDAAGQLYVDAHFPPEAKEQVTALVEQVVAAFRARLEASTWMTDATKAVALEKLDAMTLKLSYPDTWQTYEHVEMGASYFESVTNAQLAEYQRQMATAGHPVDRTERFMLAQEVNAAYNPPLNEIVFPAAFLQAPFFDPNADDAWNFGAVGSFIGHEITHGFDLQGSQFDANGNFVDWWSDEDAAAFAALNDEVVAQYDAIEVLPGLNIHGQLTVTENVADMGGLQAAFDALQAVLAEAGDPDLIDGFTPEQRFFIAWATIWRIQMRDEVLTTSILSDPHAPHPVRAVVPPQHMDAFHEAFDIGPGDAMYLPPNERIVIW